MVLLKLFEQATVFGLSHAGYSQCDDFIVDFIDLVFSEIPHVLIC